MLRAWPLTPLDVAGNRHTLPADPESRAAIVYFVSHYCPISNRYAPRIHRTCDEQRTGGVGCSMAYLGPTTTSGLIRDHHASYTLTQPAVHD